MHPEAWSTLSGYCMCTHMTATNTRHCITCAGSNTSVRDKYIGVMPYCLCFSSRDTSSRSLCHEVTAV